MLEVATPHGPARVQLHPVDGARLGLVLGHGAGGGIAAPVASTIMVRPGTVSSASLRP